MLHAWLESGRARLRRRTVLKLVLLTGVAVGSSLKLASPAPSTAATAGRVLVPDAWRRTHQPPYGIRLTLHVDEEWQKRFGSAYVQQALKVANEAQRLLSPGGVRLEAAYLGTWKPSTISKGIVGLYSDLLSVSPCRGDIIVGFTAEYDGPEGGFTGYDHRHIVVKHHPDRLDHDALVLTHEIGHDLGLEHHTCPDIMCIMSAHDFDDARGHFCIDHLELLQKNAGVFRYLEDAGISS